LSSNNRSPGVSLLKSPSRSKVRQKRPCSSAQAVAGQAEARRIGSGVVPPGADRAENRRTLPSRIETIRHFEERGRATPAIEQPPRERQGRRGARAREGNLIIGGMFREETRPSQIGGPLQGNARKKRCRGANNPGTPRRNREPRATRAKTFRFRRA